MPDVADEIECQSWYIALLHAAGGWACVATPDEITCHDAWYVALLYAPMCGSVTRRAAACWPVESLALRKPTTCKLWHSG